MGKEVTEITNRFGNHLCGSLIQAALQLMRMIKIWMALDEKNSERGQSIKVDTNYFI